MLATESQVNTYSRQDWQRGYESLPHEYDYWIEDIEGSIPAELQGTLYRNGPGLLDINGQPLSHPFDGDGMVCAFTLNKGRAHFRNRYVRTEGYLAEQKAGRILYRGCFGTQKPGGWLGNIFDLKFKNVANTNVIYWNNQLWALWEAGSPYRLDPATLETIGPDQIGGILKPNQPFSAHPRVIKDSNGQPILVNFGVNIGLSSELQIFEIDSQNSLVQSRTHRIKGLVFFHDFLVTPSYYVFFHTPFSVDALPFILGWRSISHCLRFDVNLPTRVLMIPRDGGNVQTFEIDPCFVFHHANAWEEGEQVLIDSICYDSFPNIEPDTDFRDVDFATYPKGQLWRFRIDLKHGSIEHQVLEDRSCEMPALHPDRAGQPYRFLYLNCTHGPEGNAPLQAIRKLDWQTGERQTWSAAPYGFVGEPVFVPRPGSRDEDDGWLLTLVYDAAQHCSQLVILDARNLASAPVAKLNLRHHVPFGLHGNWTEQTFI